MAAAKSGAVVAGFLGISYAIQIAALCFEGKDTFGGEGLYAVVIDLIALTLSIFLAWRIVLRQPLWASILVAVWFAVELMMKIAVIASGSQQTNPGFIFMFAALAAGAVLAVRGSWKLRAIRRSRAVTS